MNARTVIVILALILSMAWLGLRDDTEAAVGTEFGADMPVGSIVVYAGTTAPQGWLLCDGALYDVLAYPALFDVVGFTYGSNAKKDAFRVPDLAGKVAVGWKPLTYYCDTLGKTGGQAEVSLSESEMPAHQHDVSSLDHTHGMSVSAHSHTMAVSAHTHTATAFPHAHTVTDPGHSHTVNDPGHNHTINDPGHRHAIYLAFPNQFGPPMPEGGIDYNDKAETASATTGISINNRTTGLGINSRASGVSVQNTAVSVSVGSTTAGASAQNATVGVMAQMAGISISEQSRGSGAAHENLQPYLVLNYIIKY